MSEFSPESRSPNLAIVDRHLQDLYDRDPALYEASELAAASLGPIDPLCRVSVHIPAYQEGHRMYATLSRLLVPKEGATATKQIERDGTVLDPRSYEVLIYDSYKATEEPDNILDEVAKFKADYNPDVPIKILSHSLPSERNNVGYARQLLQNATCLRLKQSGQLDQPFYLVADEADIEGYDPHGLAALRDFLDANTDRLFARLTNERDPRILKQFPHLLIRYRLAGMVGSSLQARQFNDVCREVSEFCSRLPEASGASCAYPLTKLLAAGGFQPAEYGEDIDIGQRMMRWAASTKEGNLGGAFLPQVVVASPRRMLGSLIVNQPAYADGNFKAIDSLVRRPELELTERAARHYDTNQQRLITQASINRAFDRIRAHTDRADTITTPQYLSRILLLMGLGIADYSKREDGIIVHNWEGVEDRANRYTVSGRIAAAL